MPQNKLKQGTFSGNSQVPGLPGYRTRDGRTGFDPLDTNREAAHMEGTFYRKIFTLKLRTRNVFHLSLMFVFGVIPFIVLTYVIILGFLESAEAIRKEAIIPAIYLILVMAIPGAITINFILSILEIARIISPLYPKLSKQKEVKKKMPKRRKDFK